MAINLTGTDNIDFGAFTEIDNLTELTLSLVVDITSLSTSDGAFTQWGATQETRRLSVGTPPTSSTNLAIVVNPDNQGWLGGLCGASSIGTGLQVLTLRYRGNGGSADDLDIWIDGTRYDHGSEYGSGEGDDVGTSANDFRVGYSPDAGDSAFSGDYSEFAAWGEWLPDDVCEQLAAFNCPSFFHRGTGICYIPLYDTGDLHNRWGELNTAVTQSGGENAQHPAIIMPDTRIIIPSIAAAVTTGTGTLPAGTLPAAMPDLTGSGLIVISGTGTLPAATPGIVGAGTVVVPGSGTLPAGDADLTGSGTAFYTGVGSLDAEDAGLSGVGAVIIAGTGALPADDADLNGVGSIVGVVTGAGALLADEADLSGTGTVVIPGTGTLPAETGDLTGTGTVIISGTGTLPAGVADLTGAGNVLIAGTGTLPADDAGLSGVGTVSISGTGTLDADDAGLAGVGVRTVFGAGTLPTTADLNGTGVKVGVSGGGGTLPAEAAGLTGAGLRTVVGTGALPVEADITGTGTVVITGSGALDADSADLSGTGSVITSVTGGGALDADASGLTGAGVRTITGSGTLAAAEAGLSGASPGAIATEVPASSGGDYGRVRVFPIERKRKKLEEAPPEARAPPGPPPGPGIEVLSDFRELVQGRFGKEEGAEITRRVEPILLSLQSRIAQQVIAPPPELQQIIGMLEAQNKRLKDIEELVVDARMAADERLKVIDEKKVLEFMEREEAERLLDEELILALILMLIE